MSDVESAVPPLADTAPPLPAAAEEAGTATLSQWQLIALRFRRHRLAVASLFVLAFLYLLAAFAELVAPYAPDQRHLDYVYGPPQALHFSLEHGVYTLALEQHTDPITFRRSYHELEGFPVPLALFAPSEPYRLWGVLPLAWRAFGVDQAAWRASVAAAAARGLELPARVEPTFFVLGADRYGRDIFSRTIYGARVSLSVGLIGILFTFVLGMSIGGVSGYAGGRLDDFIQRGIEVLQSFPQLPLWVALAAILPGDWPALRVYFAITLLLSLLNWTGLARVVRGKILALREEEYVVAARLLGASHSRILFLHLLPGFTSHIVVALTLSVPGMILGETALSFLGLGLRPPIVSWGVMLQDCLDVKAVRFYPWLLMPVTFIVTLVLCFNFLGDGVRDAADPYR